MTWGVYLKKDGTTMTLKSVEDYHGTEERLIGTTGSDPESVLLVAGKTLTEPRMHRAISVLLDQYKRLGTSLVKSTASIDREP